MVGGEQVHRHALADNDRLRIGMTDLVFRLLR
jgi:pSer/pThr/pTyr-binding forkhead associated (FHA) protein